jgi:hypothetical protein
MRRSRWLARPLLTSVIPFSIGVFTATPASASGDRCATYGSVQLCIHAFGDRTLGFTVYGELYHFSPESFASARYT